MTASIVSEFPPMPKIARLNRDCVITEKLDGTNASINIFEDPDKGWIVQAGSRTRWITPDDDNYGFARWVYDRAEGLCTHLGPGHHFGEWWGKSIQRGYGLEERRFSLFNADRWSEATLPEWLHVVPTLYKGGFNTIAVDMAIELLKHEGSHAAPGFMDPEGIVVFHTAASLMFKVTCKGDDKGKSQENHPKKEREPRPPKDPSKGGRRKAQVDYAGPDRRVVG